MCHCILEKSLPGAAQGLGNPWDRWGCELAPMPPPSGATPTLHSREQHGASPRCHAPPARLTKAAVLSHTGALVLALGGGLADLTLEGSEEVLAKLLGHICLQVCLHEEAEALVVDGLGSAQRRRMEVQS